MLDKMEKKSFKTTEKMYVAVKEIRCRTKYAWVIVPSDVMFDGNTVVYPTPCESTNIIKEITTEAEYISFNIQESPEEIYYFWLE